jgi:hypothetical protein
MDSPSHRSVSCTHDNHGWFSSVSKFGSLIELISALKNYLQHAIADILMYKDEIHWNDISICNCYDHIIRDYIWSLCLGSLYDNVKWIHLAIDLFHAHTFDRLRISYGSSCRQEFKMIKTKFTGTISLSVTVTIILLVTTYQRD